MVVRQEKSETQTTSRCVNVNGKIGKSIIRPQSHKYVKGLTKDEEKVKKVDDAVRKLGLWNLCLRH